MTASFKVKQGLAIPENMSRLMVMTDFVPPADWWPHRVHSSTLILSGGWKDSTPVDFIVNYDKGVAFFVEWHWTMDKFEAKSGSLIITLGPRASYDADPTNVKWWAHPK